jgi:adenylate cyclase class 2
VLFRRWVFSLSDKKAYDSFIRIRTDGKSPTLTYKFRKGKGLRNTKEIETSIGDFNKVAQILSKALKEKYYQENWHETYSYNGLEITIDKWPGIPPYIEIEGPSVKKINDCIRKLHIKGKVIGNVSMIKVYEHYGKNIHSSKNLKF